MKNINFDILIFFILWRTYFARVAIGSVIYNENFSFLAKKAALALNWKLSTYSRAAFNAQEVNYQIQRQKRHTTESIRDIRRKKTKIYLLSCKTKRLPAYKATMKARKTAERNQEKKLKKKKNQTELSLDDNTATMPMNISPGIDIEK